MYLVLYMCVFNVCIKFFICNLYLIKYTIKVSIWNISFSVLRQVIIFIIIFYWYRHKYFIYEMSCFYQLTLLYVSELYRKYVKTCEAGRYCNNILFGDSSKSCMNLVSFCISTLTFFFTFFTKTV